MTVAELARRIGCTPQAIGLLETGKRQLTVAWLKRLASELECDPWSLVDEVSRGPGFTPFGRYRKLGVESPEGGG